MTTTLADMQEHVTLICEQNEILINYGARSGKAWGSRALGEIHVPQVKSPRSYATVLHEIGHILGRHQDSDIILVRERWAWEWARRNALIWTPTMQRYSAWCLEYYERKPRAKMKNVIEMSEA